MKLVMKVVKSTEVDNVKTGRLAREYREKHGIPVIVIAKRLKVSGSAVYALEAGRMPWTEERLKAVEDAVNSVVGKK